MSVTWRVLLWYQDSDPFEDYSQSEHKLLKQAANVWRDWLLGRVTDLGSFRQHLYVVQGVSSAKRDVAPNINLHVLRHIGANVVKSNHQHIVFVKLPRLFIMGVLRDERPDEWRGTEINAQGGVISPEQSVPGGFFDYVSEKAMLANTRLASISDRQKAKVLEDMRSNPVRVEESDTMKALYLDVVLGANRKDSMGG